MNSVGTVERNQKIYSDSEDLYEQLYNSEQEERKVKLNKVHLTNLNQNNQSPKILIENRNSFTQETNGILGNY